MEWVAAVVIDDPVRKSFASSGESLR